MELNPNLHYLVWQERSADAIRDAEKWRLIKSLKVQGSPAGWLQGLGLRRLVSVHPDDKTGKPKPGARQTASSPTL